MHGFSCNQTLFKSLFYFILSLGIGLMSMFNERASERANQWMDGLFFSSPLSVQSHILHMCSNCHVRISSMYVSPSSVLFYPCTISHAFHIKILNVCSRQKVRIRRKWNCQSLRCVFRTYVFKERAPFLRSYVGSTTYWQSKYTKHWKIVWVFLLTDISVLE